MNLPCPLKKPVLLFWLRTNRTNKQGQHPINLRYTCNGQRLEKTTGVYAAPAEFDDSTKRLRLTDATDKKLVGEELQRVEAANRRLSEWEKSMTDTHLLVAATNNGVASVTALKKSMQPHSFSKLSLLALHDAFLVDRASLIGVEVTSTTVKAAETRRAKLAAFLKEHKVAALSPEEFTLQVADKFLHWLLLTQGYQRNTALRYIRGISQVLTWGIRREQITANPLQFYEYKATAPKPIVYLEANEMETLSCHEFASDSLGRVRDCFVLQCWTGLAYADLATLDIPACVEQHDGRRYLRIRRAKSTTFKGYECMIPLLPEAERILAHYQDKVPVFVNAYYNRLLKETAQVCGIESKNITTHVGRKTAGVQLLNAGVPMEVVSKILGHSSVKMTEKVYARILDKTVVNAIEKAFGPALPPPAPALKIENECRVIQFRLGA